VNDGRMSVAEMAQRAADELRSLLIPGIFADTRDEILDRRRTNLAHLMAEWETGTSRGMASMYRTDIGFRHDPGYRALAKAYEAAFLDAMNRIPTMVPDFLTFCDRLAAQPLATAAD
jgi:hypothetical protein